jgi:Histone RNA hairpin-binding protein RNA-binding domain
MAELETRPAELERRQKNIYNFRKKDHDYLLYREVVAMSERLPTHPQTLELMRKCSRNYWDNKIKNWKIGVHNWARENKKEVPGDNSACVCPVPPDPEYKFYSSKTEHI